MRSSVSRQIARVVALISLGVLSPGCLIPAPDELEEPERIPPRVLLGTANPVLTQILQTKSEGEQTQINIKYVSEDLGEPIIGRLFIDYPTRKEDVGFKEMTPGSLESVREMQISWTDYRKIPTGCYSLTLTIAHAENYSRENNKPIDPDKAAFVTWWVAHDSESLNLVSLAECAPPGITE
jgi:hypothetical protein